MLKAKIGICVSCDTEQRIYAKKMCGFCYSKDYNKRLRDKMAKKVSEGKVLDKKKLQFFYKEFWDNNPDRKCHECGTPINSFRSWHVHHLAKKSKYPEHAFNQDVCVYLCLSCHDKAHSTSSSLYPQELPNTWAKYLELQNKINFKLFI